MPGSIPPPVTPVPLPPADPPDPPPPPPPAGGVPWGTKVGNGGGAAASKARKAATAAAPGLSRISRTGKNNSFRVKLHTEKLFQPIIIYLIYMIIFQQVMTKSYKYYLFLPPCRILSLSWLL